MSRSPSSRASGERRGPSALFVAWLLLLAFCAAVGGFVYINGLSDAARTGGDWAFVLPLEDDAAEPPAPIDPYEPLDGTPTETVVESRPAGPPAVADPPATEDQPTQVTEPDQTSQSVPAETVDESQTTATEAAPEPEPTESTPVPDPAPSMAAKKTPRIAVVVTGLGLSQAVSEMAIARLPAAVTLSFSPYADDLAQWFARARARGHEVMIDLPMEPSTFPQDDPGPRALLTGLDAAQNLERLQWILARGQGALGVAAVMGSRFTTSEADLHPILQELKARGVLFLDNRSSEQSVSGRLAADLALRHAINDRSLDDGTPNRESIRARLAQIERLAVARGNSIAMGRSLPVTLERLVDWAEGLESRGFALVPLSTLVGSADSG